MTFFTETFNAALAGRKSSEVLGVVIESLGSNSYRIATQSGGVVAASLSALPIGASVVIRDGFATVRPQALYRFEA